MKSRTLIALLSSIGGGLVVAGGAAIGARAGVKGQRAASQRVVEMLPTHAEWWRERLHHEGQLTYLAIGDSAAQGVGATVPSRGYVGLLARRIKHRSRTTVRVVNLSVSGATTWGAKKDQLPKLQNFTPDVCTVSIGANDIADFHPDKFERNIRAIYAAVPSHAVVAELPCMFSPDRERKVAVANEIIHRVADELGLTVAPLHAITKRVGIRRTFFNTYGDLFHPNDRGLRDLGERLRAGDRRPRGHRRRDPALPVGTRGRGPRARSRSRRERPRRAGHGGRGRARARAPPEPHRPPARARDGVDPCRRGRRTPDADGPQQRSGDVGGDA